MKPYEILFSWYCLEESKEKEDVYIAYGVDAADAEKNFMLDKGSKLNWLTIEEINLNYDF